MPISDVEPREAVVNPMPIGCSDFRTLRDRGLLYVDKSMFVDRILEHHAKVDLIVCPDGYGKSMNLSMLDAYVNIRYAGEPDHFEGLRISEERPEDPDKNSDYVIRMDFRNLDTGTFRRFVNSFGDMMADIYEGFPELEGSEEFDEVLQDRRRTILGGAKDCVLIEWAVVNLTEMIEDHHGKKPIVLIDDYDYPLIATSGRDRQQKIRGFLDNTLGMVLKDNNHLKYAVVTGQGDLRDSELYGINNSMIDDAFSDGFGGLFGFTRAEVEALLEGSGCSDAVGAIDAWFDEEGFGDDELCRPEEAFRILDSDRHPRQGLGARTPWLDRTVWHRARRSGTDHSEGWIRVGATRPCTTGAGRCRPRRGDPWCTGCTTCPDDL